MSVCEACWTEASRRAAMLGGHTADHYRTVCADEENRARWHSISAPSSAGVGLPGEQETQR